MKTVYVLTWDYYMPTAHEYVLGVYDTPEQAREHLVPLTRELLQEEAPDVRSALEPLADDELIQQFWDGERNAHGDVLRYPIGIYRITETTYHTNATN